MYVEGTKIKAQIWDTAGQERFSQMMGTYYRKAKAAVLVYDVSDKSSFKAVESWRQELETHGESDTTLLLVGNKSDLKSAVTAKKARKYAHQHNMIFVEVSAKTGKNVAAAFDQLLAAAYTAHNKGLSEDGGGGTVRLSELRDGAGADGSCCG